MEIAEPCHFYSLPSFQIRIVLRHTVRVLLRGENFITEVGTVSDNSMGLCFSSKIALDSMRISNALETYTIDIIGTIPRLLFYI